MYFPHHWVTADIKLWCHTKVDFSAQAPLNLQVHYSEKIHSETGRCKVTILWTKDENILHASSPPPAMFKSENWWLFLLTFHCHIWSGYLCSFSALCHPWTICRMAGGSPNSLHISKRSLCPLLHWDSSVSSVLEGQLQREENKTNRSDYATGLRTNLHIVFGDDRQQERCWVALSKAWLQIKGFMAASTPCG